ncbi:MAG: exopolysaccharide production protein ExoQ [Psychroserpens sp.]|jgi:exopolysaccharide production protein ExoQ
MKMRDRFLLSSVFLLFLLVTIVNTLPFTSRNSWLLFTETDNGDAIIWQFLYLSLLIGGGAGILRTIPLRKLNITIYFWLLLSWCLGSAFWSPNPIDTLKTCFVTFTVFYFIFVNVQALGAKQILNITGNVLFIIIFLSLISVFNPNAFHLSSDPEPSTIGALRGVLYHKNTLGSAAAFALLFNFFKYNIFCNKPRLRVLAYIPILSVLIMSKSLTSLVLSIIVIGYSYNFRLYNNLKKKSSLIKIFVALLISYLFFIWFAQIAIQDGTTLSGRGLIWGVLLNITATSPLFGQGYGALYGAGDVSVFANSLDSGYYWYRNVSSGHNGYLDLLASIGIIGTFFFLSMFVWQMFCYLKVIGKRTNNDNFMRFVLSLTIFIFLHNLIESSFLNKTKIPWIILSIVFSVIYFTWKNENKGNFTLVSVK